MHSVHIHTRVYMNYHHEYMYLARASGSCTQRNLTFAPNPRVNESKFLHAMKASAMHMCACMYVCMYV